MRSQSRALKRMLNRLYGQRWAGELFRIPEADTLMGSRGASARAASSVNNKEAEVVDAYCLNTFKMEDERREFLKQFMTEIKIHEIGIIITRSFSLCLLLAVQEL